MSPKQSEPFPISKEFEADVFPAELIEIATRREKLRISQSRLPSLEITRILRQKLEDAAAHGTWSELVKQTVVRVTDSFSRYRSGAPEPPPQATAQTAEEIRSELRAYNQANLRPSPDYGLTGIAISGGGIRSATFALGVLQSLAAHKVLRFADYISTVSGGGYIGSCLSAILTGGKYLLERNEFPFDHASGPDSDPLRYIRQNAQYLSQGKLADLRVIPVIILRGILLNLLVLLPAVIALALITDQIAEHASLLTGIWPAYSLTMAAGAAFLLICFLYPVFLALQRTRKSPASSARIDSWLSYTLSGFVIFGLVEIGLPAVIGWYSFSEIELNILHILSGAGTAIMAITGLLSMGRIADYLGHWAGKLAIAFCGLMGPAILFVLYLYLTDILLYAPYDDVVQRPLMLGGLALFVYSWWIDMNSTSLHGVYRDRLSRTFLFRYERDGAGKVERKLQDKLNLSALNTNAAPYHLINVTLNLAGSSDPGLYGRNSDFFIFSKCYSGSERTGYIPTADLEQKETHLNLGTAMAISGAAAAPNMGTTTIKPVVFLMALLNIRMGYWMTNPFALKNGAVWRKLTPGVGPMYLLKEMFGRMPATGTFVNLSDGGHLENLGIYELLRRRCKYIIAIDAEADQNMAFPSLAAVMRFAEIDLDIGIDIDLTEVRKNAEGWSSSHCALSTIDYRNGDLGYLLYIKCSATGDETEYVRQYKASHPSFPHESTADQFFDEAQFEAYRCLGEHAFDSLFSDGFEFPCTIDEWFENLTRTLRPAFIRQNQFTGLQSDLIAMSNRFSDPAVAAYTYEIFPELGPPPGPVSSEQRRRIFHVCDAQIQLMENVYIALELNGLKNRDDHMNRGWMNLFRRWAQAPSFRRAWAIVISTYSDGFQRFCEETLGLRYTVTLRPANEDEPALLLGRQNVEQYVQRGDQIWVGELTIDLNHDDRSRKPFRWAPPSSAPAKAAPIWSTIAFENIFGECGCSKL